MHVIEIWLFNLQVSEDVLSANIECQLCYISLITLIRTRSWACRHRAGKNKGSNVWGEIYMWDSFMVFHVRHRHKIEHLKIALLWKEVKRDLQYLNWALRNKNKIKDTKRELHKQMNAYYTKQVIFKPLLF